MAAHAKLASTVAKIGFRAMIGLTATLVFVALGAGNSKASPLDRPRLTVAKPKKVAIKPPKVPKGFPVCEDALPKGMDLPRSTGETLRYQVDVGGFSVGTIDFRVERNGNFGGHAVTEYRSLFKLDSLVSTFVPVVGRAATIVAQNTIEPMQAMNRYRLRSNEYEERVLFASGARTVASDRKKNGKEKSVKRTFAAPVIDFVSGFYLVRSLMPGFEGCAVIYGNQRAYTIWIDHEGQEKVETPVGKRMANRYSVRYASEKSKKARSGTFWIGTDAARLPYRAEISGTKRVVARIDTYEQGGQ